MKLGGKDFVVVSQSTIEWDITLLTLVQGLGLADLVKHGGEDAEAFARRIFRALTSSPKIFDVLGCVLVPAGTDAYAWTPELQRETSTFIKRLHEPADKAAINSQIVSLVTSFFQQGLLSFTTSPMPSPLLERAAAVRTSENGATTTSANGV